MCPKTANFFPSSVTVSKETVQSHKWPHILACANKHALNKRAGNVRKVDLAWLPSISEDDRENMAASITMSHLRSSVGIAAMDSHEFMIRDSR